MMGVMTRLPRPGLLRLAQAHRPIFYLPHVVADAIGALRRRSLALEVVSMPTSGQWDALSAGAADLAIGGPMRSMRLLQEGRRVVTFASAVATSPWVLVGPPGAAGLGDPTALGGRTVLDDAEIATARLCLRGLMAERAPMSPMPEVVSLPRDELMRRIGAQGSFALLPYETVVELEVERQGRGRVVAELAGWVGRVPWSAYQALPEVLDRRRPEVDAFTDAIGEALQVIAVERVDRLADLVSPWFHGTDRSTLEAALSGYRRLGIWDTSPTIPREDLERFAGLLVSAGWLSAAPRHEDVVSWRDA